MAPGVAATRLVQHDRIAGLETLDALDPTSRPAREAVAVGSLDLAPPAACGLDPQIPLGGGELDGAARAPYTSGINPVRLRQALPASVGLGPPAGATLDGQ